MNKFFLATILLLFAYYGFSLIGDYVAALSLFFLSLISLLAGIIKELGIRKKVPYLRLVK